MTVYKLVAAVKVHLCNLSKLVEQVLSGQSSDREVFARTLDKVGAQLAETNARLAELETQNAELKASLVRIEAAVFEDDNAAGIRLTVTAQQ